MTDLQHKFNCQTQEGYHGGTNRAYWCSCALEERKEIKSLQQRIAELEIINKYLKKRITPPEQSDD